MNKFMGGVLLITGTSIGAGMLALPIATAKATLVSNMVLMVACWMVMNVGALFILEVNSWCESGSNLITMARKTLGVPGEILTWVVYLLLLYALLCAYIEGGTQITQHWLQAVHLSHSNAISSIVFLLMMGTIVFKGIHWVDLVNRGLMSMKFLLLFALLILIMPFMSSSLYQQHDVINPLSATPVIITSFGFATIVPSLRVFFDNDLKKLRLAIVIGSSIPLVIYLFWVIIVQGVVPIEGADGLLAMKESGNATTQLANALAHLSHSKIINEIAQVFTSICVLTSFLGVALSLSDFLADGTRLGKNSLKSKNINMLMTFLPPLLVVLFYPHIFIALLGYAGIFCVILLMLLPALMVWRGRYHGQFSSHGQAVLGGKLGVLFFIMLSLGVVGLSAVYR